MTFCLMTKKFKYPYQQLKQRQQNEKPPFRTKPNNEKTTTYINKTFIASYPTSRKKNTTVN